VSAHPPYLRIVRPGEQPTATGPAPGRPRTSWTADELMTAQFPEPRWAVPGLLAEGVNLLAGPPKVGKSWLSLGLALAVASGGRALDGIDVTGGPVLYLALEDTPRRLQARMRRMLGPREQAPHGLTLATACPPLPDGGAQAIAAWLARNPDARMVVIDVFAKMRGRSPAGMSAYDADYAAISAAKALADSHGVALVLVHHVRKAGSEDFLAEVSGTNGLAGAADATLVLKRPRGQADGLLCVTGRDVDESEYALRFIPEAGAWCLMDGPPGDYTLSDTRAAILRHVRQRPGSGPAVIAEATGLARETVKKTCQRMAADGQLAADAAGRYRLPGTPEPPATVPGVPGVPVPGLTCGNEPAGRGHLRGPGVPGVPGPLLTCEDAVPHAPSSASPAAGGASPDPDALFVAIEDVLAAAHPSAAEADALPDVVTDAVAELAEAFDAATGTGPHDALVAAARQVMAAVTSRGNRLRDMVPAFTSLARALTPTCQEEQQ
jgi:biotin operon repressor